MDKTNGTEIRQISYNGIKSMTLKDCFYAYYFCNYLFNDGNTQSGINYLLLIAKIP